MVPPRVASRRNASRAPQPASWLARFLGACRCGWPPPIGCSTLACGGGPDNRHKCHFGKRLSARHGGSDAAGHTGSLLVAASSSTSCHGHRACGPEPDTEGPPHPDSQRPVEPGTVALSASRMERSRRAARVGLGAGFDALVDRSLPRARPCSQPTQSGGRRLPFAASSIGLRDRLGGSGAGLGPLAALRRPTLAPQGDGNLQPRAVCLPSRTGRWNPLPSGKRASLYLQPQSLRPGRRWRPTSRP
jgi:hypothetical protein